MAKDYSQMTDEQLTEAVNQLDEKIQAIRAEKFLIKAVRESRVLAPVAKGRTLTGKGVAVTEKFGKGGG